MNPINFKNPFKDKAQQLKVESLGGCLTCGGPLKYIASEQEAEIPTVRKYCCKLCRRQRYKKNENHNN